MNYEKLKEQHRARRESFSKNLDVRVHRALSWLNRSEMCGDDLDGEFIFLWISFNSAYAYDVDEQYRKNAQSMFDDFFGKIVELDSNNRLYQQVWSEFSSSVRVLLDNEFTFQPFWDFKFGRIPEAEWRERFEASKRKAKRGLADQDTAAVLAVVFRRLYTLRNQMMHGAATWNGSVNRAQVQDSTKLLRVIQPLVIQVMMENPSTLWGDPFYPVVD